MKVDRSKITEEYYTTQELADAPWFPARSMLTIQKLVEAGKLSAVDISTNPKRRRYRVKRESIIKFLENN